MANKKQVENQKSVNQKIFLKAAQQLYEKQLSQFFTPTHLMATLDKVEARIRPEIIRSVDSMFADNKIGLFIMGPPGTGKTAIFKIIMEMYYQTAAGKYSKTYEPEKFPNIDWAYREKFISVLCMTHGELVKKLRGDALENPHDKVYCYPDKILLLDDLGRAYDDKSGWNIALQDEFFDLRWRHKVPTFISTNFAADKLRQWEGWERMIDRMGDKSWMKAITLSGKSRR